jgi:hypothetical protein
MSSTSGYENGVLQLGAPIFRLKILQNDIAAAPQSAAMHHSVFMKAKVKDVVLEAALILGTNSRGSVLHWNSLNSDFSAAEKSLIFC